jgi:hypothetical protein
MMLICLVGIMAACKKDHHDPNFVKGINNPYFPLVPGDTYHYVNTITEGKDITTQDIEVTVTKDTKVILGVTCEVIHDVVKEDGKVTEDTYDWYAQDKQGNVWYFGESTKALDNGIWSTEGSWEAGVKGARQGIIMYGNPKAHIGEVYYEEFWYQHAEDQAEVVNTNSTAKVAYGTFNNCVKTKEFTRLTPDEIENKYFAAGVGQILAVVTITGGGSEREELISITH